MKTFNAVVKCEKCGGESFSLTKEGQADTRYNFVFVESMCHDGYGWDLGTFKYTCTTCKTPDTVTVEVLEDTTTP